MGIPMSIVPKSYVVFCMLYVVCFPGLDFVKTVACIIEQLQLQLQLQLQGLHGAFCNTMAKTYKKMARFASRARFGKNLPRSKNDVISQFAIGLLWQKPKMVFGRFKFLP